MDEIQEIPEKAHTFESGLRNSKIFMQKRNQLRNPIQTKYMTE
jgi:hypothetical protein